MPFKTQTIPLMEASKKVAKIIESVRDFSLYSHNDTKATLQHGVERLSCLLSNQRLQHIKDTSGFGYFRSRLDKIIQKKIYLKFLAHAPAHT